MPINEILQSKFRGFTLIGVLVALVVVAFGGTALLQLVSSQQNFFSSLTKKDIALQILNSTIGNLNRESFNSLVSLCIDKNIFNAAQPAIGSCSALAPTGSTDLTINPYQLEVLRDWSGNNSSSGEVCVELSQCRSLADNHLLDVTLNVFFRASAQRVGSGTITFRRTRW
jgi:type II secretory pathway pseudopilin PulG